METPSEFDACFCAFGSKVESFEEVVTVLVGAEGCCPEPEICRCPATLWVRDAITIKVPGFISVDVYAFTQWVLISFFMWRIFASLSPLKGRRDIKSVPRSEKRTRSFANDVGGNIISVQLSSLVVI